MRQDDVRILFDYLYWVRDRVVDAAGQLPNERFTSPETVTTRDLRATLVHELDVEWSWRERLRGANWDDWGPDAELKPADYPTLQAVVEHWKRDEEETRAWVEALTDAELEAPWSDTDRPGLPLWFHVMHLVTHGIQQLADAAVLLTASGASPGELDFLEYAEQRHGKGVS